MPESATSEPSIEKSLLRWYDRHRRDLPWRAAPGARPDPYRVWLSEIMLQQTTVATVKGRFEEFLARWPTVADLAAADLDEVLHEWQGLGYYARARNLHKCARVVAGDLGGRFPDTEAGLLALPGIGPYTAAAVAAIAFDRPVVPVDGNVERVTARLHAVAAPMPGAKAEIARLARRLGSGTRPGDLAQALMDLGATVCAPARPACASCPLSPVCRAFANGDPEAYPVKARKKRKPTRYGVAFWLRRSDGRVLFRRRPERGLLGGMIEVPVGEWREEDPAVDLSAAPAAADWRFLPGEVRHTFTHFHLVLKVAVAEADPEMVEGFWHPVGRLDELALPTVMKKVVGMAISER